MHIEKTHIILFVSDQTESTERYCLLFNKMPRLDVPGMTEFELSEHLILGLMPNEGSGKILTPVLPHPSKGNGIPRCEVYLYVKNLEAEYARCQTLPFTLVSPLETRNWGDRAFYLADGDGHVIGVAERG
jgi:lactoylglutathione lyase